MNCNLPGPSRHVRSASRYRSRSAHGKRPACPDVRVVALLGVAVALGGCLSEVAEPLADPSDRLELVPFTAVRVNDGFWAPRIETNRTVTIPVSLRRSEETGRISNFARAGRLEDGGHQGKRYDDSDVFKIIEGASYSLGQSPDPVLDGFLDDLIRKIASAQEDDGYLYTIRTLGEAATNDMAGPERWSYLAHSHELYNVGHMYEAAVAHHRATGKRELIDVALKSAELVDAVFGPDGNHDVPGHEEIEIGLVKLYELTEDRKHLALAQFFVDQRGHHALRTDGGVIGADDFGSSPEYNQDHLPVREQNSAVGHAVRALYLYSAVADVAAMTGDGSYIPALDSMWSDLVERKTYLTGGLGSRRDHESFGPAFGLENATAYNETCAAVASVLWNYRLFLLHGDAAYLDVVERTLYNGVLSGVSLDGESFFYVNPLASDGRAPFNQGGPVRRPWFSTSCCPTNMARFLPSVPGYLYSTRDDDLYVNLFAGSESEINTATNRLQVTQTTDYPWSGDIEIKIRPERVQEFRVWIRIPGWAQNRPLPSNLYRYADHAPLGFVVRINGEAASGQLRAGFFVISRTWRDGDTISLHLPMEPRIVLSHDNVTANAGLAALERGPLVYCVEGADNGGTLREAAIRSDASIAVEWQDDLLGGVSVLQWDRQVAVPYYAWANRGPGPMAVWLPYRKGSSY